MSKKYPSTKYTASPYRPGCIIDEEGTELPPTHLVKSGRRILAGKGLKGGGDLSKDRELEVDFGTTEGTVAQGNDPRFTDGRDWNAPAPTEEEITEGTETAPRKLSPKNLHNAAEAWWNKSTQKEHLESIEEGATKNRTDDYLLNRQYHKGTQPISSIQNLQEILNSLGSSSSSGDYFSIIKEVNLFDEEEYVLTELDIGRTIIINSPQSKINIKMNACFGTRNDEIYIVAPRAFVHRPADPINFFTQIGNSESGGSTTKIPPVVATGLVPSFRDGRSIVCLKKCFTGGVGMDDWLLFGDLAKENV